MATCTVEVDGITGGASPAICSGSDRTWPVVHPGDKVLVKVTRANLLHYAYAVKVEQKTLSLVYPVVGVGEVGQLQELGIARLSGGGARLSPSCGRDPAGLDEAGLRSALIDCTMKLQELRQRAADALAPIELLGRSGNELWDGNKDANGWPIQYRDTVGAFEAEALRLGPDLAQFQRTAASLSHRAEVLQLEREAASKPATGQPTPNPLEAAGGPLAGLFTQLNELGTRAATYETALREAALVVGRWKALLARKPVVEHETVVDRSSKRYEVTVERTPFTAVAGAIEARPVSGDTKDKPQAPSTIASFAFEGHAWHRFNVSLGFAQTYRPDSGAFGIVPQLGEDDAISYSVRRTEDTAWKSEGVALLGVYFHPIDNYDLNRSPAWMVTIGTDISAAPSTYLLGLAVDFSNGFVLGFGALEYDKVQLADGWHEGQVVPLKDDGTPRISAVPTFKKDSLGAYLTLAFRPGIFKAFWDRRK